MKAILPPWASYHFPKIHESGGGPSPRVHGAYINDIFYLINWEDPPWELQAVLQELRDFGLTNILAKFSLKNGEPQYLGFHVEHRWAKPLQNRTETLIIYEHSATKKQVRAFLELANSYRKFVPHFLETLAPLMKLTKAQALLPPPPHTPGDVRNWPPFPEN